MADDRQVRPGDEEPLSLAGEEELEPISLVEEGPKQVQGPSTLQAFGAAAIKKEKEIKLKRPVNVTGQGATRCRIFHSKIAVASLEYMEGQINQWIDGQNIEVKQVGHVIGVMEGKTPEPNLIVTVWY